MVTEYLRKERNSLAESGMRVLRMEIEHDGFRSEKGRDNCLRMISRLEHHCPLQGLIPVIKWDTPEDIAWGLHGKD